MSNQNIKTTFSGLSNIGLHYNTSVGWANNNLVLNTGELGYESNTGLYKVGDGTNTWSTLPYVVGGGGGGASSIAGSAGVLIGGTLSSNLSLSKEEIAELEQLRRDHQLKIKSAKLNEFKNLAKEIRQQVINNLEWRICQEKMNAASYTPKDNRLIELETKEAYQKMFTIKGSGSNGMAFGNLNNYTGYSQNITFGGADIIPEGVSVEDLKQAHMEAALEEEVFSDGKTD